MQLSGPRVSVPLDTSQDQPRLRTWHRYGRRVRYVAFREAVLAILEAKGCDAGMVAALPPDEAVHLAVEVVCERLDFADVDILPEFRPLRRQYGGLWRAVDVCFDLGKGGCDKYAALTAHVFGLLRRGNPRLDNVYLVPFPLGADRTRHDLGRCHRWNSILLLTDRTLYVSQIDPTFYDALPR